MNKPQRCPICEKQFSASEDSGKSHLPFCSDRCRKVDLFRWFDGKYAVVEDIDPMVAQFMQEDPDITIQGEGMEDNSNQSS